MTGDVQARVGARSMGSAAAIALAVIIVVLAASALLAGPSLDDYWTLYLSDSSRGIDKLVDQRWIQDIRPPIFDAWATLLSALGIQSIPIARLVSNAPALAILLYAARRFATRLPEQRSYYTIFLLLMLSAPATIGAFGVYRGDFWQLAAFAIQILLARHIVFADRDYRSRTDAGLAFLAIPATILAITVDFGGSLFGGILAMATVLAAIARGFRRWAQSLLVAMAAAVAAVVYIISWQAPAWAANFDLYQNWIEMETSTALGIIMALLFGTILHNPVAVGGAYIGRLRWTRGDSGFAIMIGASLVAVLIAILQIEAQRRLITPSNTADIAVLATALMAAAGVMVTDRRLWRNAIAGVAALSAIIGVTVIGFGGGWQTGAKRIARIVDACPSTKVHTASGWRLDAGTASRAARREEPVFALGYRLLSSGHGFASRMVRPDLPAKATPDQCPVLLWIEQVPVHKHPKAANILKAAGLGGLDAARLSVIRTDSGLIVRADR